MLNVLLYITILANQFMELTGVCSLTTHWNCDGVDGVRIQENLVAVKGRATQNGWDHQGYGNLLHNADAKTYINY